MPFLAAIPAAIGGIGAALGGASGISGLIGAGTGIAGALNSGHNAKQTEGQINGLYQPYTAAGATAINQINNMLSPGFDAEGYTKSLPGYQFQLDQGLQAGDRAAAAAGTLNSGGTLKAQTRYGQDFAQNAYQTALNNLYKTAGLGVAANGDMASNIASGNQGQTNATNGILGAGGNLLGNLFSGGSGGGAATTPYANLSPGLSIAANSNNPLALNTTLPNLSFGGI
jgi:hypothetical protein